LAEGVPNDGAETIIVPNTPSEEARVMVMNSEGTFFDISNNDFTVIGLTNGFLIEANDTVQSACVGENLVFDLSLQSVGGFDEMVTLSLEGSFEGVNAVLADNTLMTGETTTLTISGTEGVEAGVLDILVVGSATSFDQSLSLQAGFNSIVPEVATLLIPQDGAEFVPTDLTLDWESADSPDAIYTVELSPDPTFETEVVSIVSEVFSQTAVSGLQPATTYYWRVQKETTCSTGEFSEVFSFTTHSCFSFVSSDVPLTISAISGEFISTLEIPFEGIIQDLNVSNLEGVHGSTGQLEVSLISPAGVEVILFSEICDGTQDFNLGFDDSAELEVVDCPATAGLSYTPSESLSSFIGEGTAGTWSLVITDNTNGGGGSLNGWSIELCVASSGSFALAPDQEVAQVCQGESTSVSVTAEEVFEFENTILLSATDLPEGITVDFNPSLISTGESSEVTVIADLETSSDVFTLSLVGTSGEMTDTLEFDLEVNPDSPEAIELLNPSEEDDVSTLVLFEWESITSPSAVYALEIATDDLFSDIVESVESLSQTSITLEGLPPSQTLYWRVTADNGCVSSSSDVRSFTTQACAIEQAGDGLPLNISPIASVYSAELEIMQEGTVQDISIPNLQGTHFRINDLVVSLESPQGTEVVLFTSICSGDQDFDLGFFEGANAEIDCPPTTGDFYAPEDSFSAFAGENAQGIWTLKINDTENGGGGQLNGWSLQVCYEDNVFSTYNSTTSAFTLYPNPTHDYITVSSKEGSIEEIVVYDLYGRLLDQMRVDISSEVNVDFSHYPKGGYLLEVRGPFGVETKKIIRH